MIYADHAATTPLLTEALDAMLPFLKEDFGNASTLYRPGRVARQALEEARERAAACLGAAPTEIFFTSGGSEADNWALKGTLRRLSAQGKSHLIVSAIEHPAVLNSAKALEKEGFALTVLPVDRLGRVRVEDVLAAIRPETALVSVMAANNETGVLQPYEEIGALCRGRGVLFHTDAVQAVPAIAFRLKDQPIDLLSLSAHKFGGPKGVGILYCRKKTAPQTLIDGGEQERGHRAGTENVAAAVGLATALEIACRRREEVNTLERTVRDGVEGELLRLPGVTRNGDPDHRLPGIANLSFPGFDGQELVYELDARGVCASMGSACSSGNLSPSHVLLAMGLSWEAAHGSLRLSFGAGSRTEEISQVVAAVREAVQYLEHH